MVVSVESIFNLLFSMSLALHISRTNNLIYDKETVKNNILKDRTARTNVAVLSMSVSFVLMVMAIMSMGNTAKIAATLLYLFAAMATQSTGSEK